MARTETDSTVASSMSGGASRSRRWKRAAAVTVSGTLLAAAAPLLMASPAQAWSSDCQQYLRNKGYNVPIGGKAYKSCNYAEDWYTDPDPEVVWLFYCRAGLEDLGVKHSYAVTACKKGANLL
ncbi:hypothetical protein [Streptomyces afghaniensis]|uniref:hypothetical protein n=1 Tax=Streptomyces afghaniensis TaxID=66865 RepID=UPI002784FA8D|nr:hypothetical protein [Streptomyces afghaniensis]MDQ1013595.1 hypothetical protein [Streptomyces afghaniensis]